MTWRRRQLVRLGGSAQWGYELSRVPLVLDPDLHEDEGWLTASDQLCPTAPPPPGPCSRRLVCLALDTALQRPQSLTFPAMQSTRGKSVLWDPSPPSPSSPNRLLVGGGAELRLYSCSHPRHSFTATSVVTELAGLRAFAWAPHPQVPLVAAGLSTGRVLLLRLDDAPHADDRHKRVPPPAAQINGARHSSS